MLAYILAIAVGLGSFALYMAAFFFPEVHRKHDFTWSGVGMFYALVLWVCAGRITGGVLLGQLASVALLGWFGWQTLLLRRELTPAISRTQPGTQQPWRSPLKPASSKLPQSSAKPWWSGVATLPSKAVATATTALALVRVTWETTRQSMQKPAKPSRPTIVRSPKGTKEKKPREPRQPLEKPIDQKVSNPSAEEMTAEVKGAEQVLEGAIAQTNLANPNNSLELLEDDFFEDEVAATDSPTSPDFESDPTPSPEATDLPSVSESISRSLSKADLPEADLSQGDLPEIAPDSTETTDSTTAAADLEASESPENT